MRLLVASSSLRPLISSRNYCAIPRFGSPANLALVSSTAERREGQPGSAASPLDDRELFGWRTYVETVTDLSNAIEADLAVTGLTLGDYQVFVFLSEVDDGAMRMCDLADKLQLSPSGLTRRLDGLVRGGYIDRRTSAQDRRVMLAVLTNAGRRKLDEAYPVHLASVRRRVIDRLSAPDVDALGRIFATIQAALPARAIPTGRSLR